MSQSKTAAFSLFVFYFLILLSLSVLFRDAPNQPDALSVTLPELIKTSRYADPGYSATAAIDIATNGWISDGNEWIFNLWPPGFAVLESFVLRVFGSEAPVLLVLQVLASLLFSLVLVLLRGLLEICVGSRLAMTLPLLIFAFPVSRFFLLQPLSISFGESFAVGFFLAGALLSVLCVIRNQIHLAAYAGLCIALSAYFRPQFEIILLGMTLCGGVAWSAQFTRLRNFFDTENSKATIKMLVVVLIVAHAATLPWRIYHLVYQGNPSWVQTGNLVFENSVKSTDTLKNNHGGFVADGGGNIVCRIDPDACDDKLNAKKKFVETFAKHPIKWYSIKSELFVKYWFSSIQDMANVVVEPKLSEIIINGINMLAVFSLFLLSASRKVRSHKMWGPLFWFNTSLLLSYGLIFTVTHFEVRYLYFPKIYSVLAVLLMLSLKFRSKIS